MQAIDPIQGTFNRSERRKAAKALRKSIPFHVHGDWQPAENRANPICLLQAQDTTRLQHLVPIKYGRMLEFPFAFLRGSAVVMASDLATTPVTDYKAQICGDAHISNFGLFASLERKLVFDVNDFDESTLGPWEWDLKRLATSAFVAARKNGFSDHSCQKMASSAAKTYRSAMHKLARMSNLDVWYFETSVGVLQSFLKSMTSKNFLKEGKQLVDKARKRTQSKTVKKLTYKKAGRRLIKHNPPLVESLRKTELTIVLADGQTVQNKMQFIEDTWAQYLDSLPVYRRVVLNRFRIVDAALRVGGVGSVGTRCYIILLESDAEKEGLILQLKEAGPSSLSPFLDQQEIEQSGERVVTAQRLMQVSGDAFLGWHTSELTGVDYYWRQFKDMKGSADVDSMKEEDMLRSYIEVCGGCLARAHARTGDATSISGYLGKKGDEFPDAIAKFAQSYADQTEHDYQSLVAAVKSGQVIARKGV